MTEYETLTIELLDFVAIITLNRPERRNALNDQLLRELRSCLQELNGDARVRAAVLAGAGQTFCAGADLAGYSRLPTPDEVEEILLKHFNPVILLLAELPIPVIAAVNGAAAGAGAALALACDLRVMANDAALIMAFSNVGLSPDSGASWFLARQLGYSRAFELLAEGARIPASRCLELGLANRVASSSSVLAAALGWAGEMAGRPTLALSLTKRALVSAQVLDLDNQLTLEARLQRESCASHDYREGVKAFLEKRKPRFLGR